jgi:hypothetical protein
MERGDQLGQRGSGFWLFRLFKVVNHGSLAAGFEDLFHKFHVQRVDLVGLFSFFARENEVQGDLVALVYDAAFAWGHPADVETQDSLDGAQVAFGSGDELLGCVRDFRAGPENNNV